MQNNGVKDTGSHQHTASDLLSHHYQQGAAAPRTDYGTLASLLQQQVARSPICQPHTNYFETFGTPDALLARRTDLCLEVQAYLLLQGVMSPNVNLNDPAVQAHVFHLITQVANQPNTWGPASQPGGSHNLEHILTQISQRPEIVANLPGLINSLAGQQPQSQKLDPASVGAADGGPPTYTAQLYGGAASGCVPNMTFA